MEKKKKNESLTTKYTLYIMRKLIYLNKSFYEFPNFQIKPDTPLKMHIRLKALQSQF